MKKNLSIGRAKWKKLGEDVAKRIVTRTKAGKGLDDDFAGYSAKYKKYKKKGGKKTRGESKGNLRFPRQTSFSETPDLTLTGDMLRDLQVREVDNNGVSIGWEGAFAERVKHNAKNGREITSKKKPLANTLAKYVNKQIEKLTKQKADKYYKKKQKIKVKL